MKTRLKRGVQLSGWTVPLSYALGAIILGMTFPRVEHYFLPKLVSTMSAASAMAMCSAIASGMLALTGIVFSLAFIMVQFSASAYSPRLVNWVAGAPIISHSLGVFSATFLYALAMLAWVDRSASGKVPFISAYLVLGLLLASMGMFIALIEGIRLLQVNKMLIFTGNCGRKAIEKLYQSLESMPADGRPGKHRKMGLTQTLTYSGRPQVLQAVDIAHLLKVATESDAVIEVTSAVGDTLFERTPLLQVYGARRKVDEEVLRGALVIGDERTFEQDPKYAIRLLVDIAIKALSPAINDPTTAVQALDQIEDMLFRLGQCRLEIGQSEDDRGVARVILHFPRWDDFLRLALDEIRFCGANSVQVMRRMKALIENLITVLPIERRGALQHWEYRVQATIARTFADKEEKEEASVADRQGLGIGGEEAR